MTWTCQDHQITSPTSAFGMRQLPGGWAFKPYFYWIVDKEVPEEKKGWLGFWEPLRKETWNIVGWNQDTEVKEGKDWEEVCGPQSCFHGGLLIPGFVLINCSDSLTPRSVLFFWQFSSHPLWHISFFVLTPKCSKPLHISVSSIYVLDSYLCRQCFSQRRATVPWIGQTEDT